MCYIVYYSDAVLQLHFFINPSRAWVLLEEIKIIYTC